MNIAMVSGSRADWGLLAPVARAILDHPKLALRLWVTGSHLEQRFGYTADAIEADGFAIDAKVPLHLSTDSADATAQALAKAISGFAELIAKQRPDCLLVLGDRYEIFGAVQAAHLARVPVAHIAGGDISEGAYDDAMRHAISKLSQLHFPTNDEARERLLRMGELPERVILSGSPGIDAIVQTPRLSRAELASSLACGFGRQNILVSFHPATLDALSAQQQVDTLLEGLQRIDSEISLWLSGSNADTGGDQVNQALRGFAETRPNTCFVQSFGAQRYYSMLHEVDLLVGNSSSGLYEAPTLGTPTLNIGTRQQGRLHGPSVVHCALQAAQIADSIEDLLREPPQDFTSPYGDGRAAQRIAEALAAIEDADSLLFKSFPQGKPA